MNEEGIKRINELAAAAKQRELTDEESSERAKLRAEYLADFKAGFKKTLENVSVRYPDGKIVPIKEANKPARPPRD